MKRWWPRQESWEACGRKGLLVHRCAQSSVLLTTCSQGPYPKTPELAVLPRSVICTWKTRSSIWLMAWHVVFTRTSLSTHSRRAVRGMTVLSNTHLKLNEDEPLPRSRRTIRNHVTTFPAPIFLESNVYAASRLPDLRAVSCSAWGRITSPTSLWSQSCVLVLLCTRSREANPTKESLVCCEI